VTSASLGAPNWHRRILGLAGPIILANLTQPLLGAVDTAIAGHLPGAASLGGVALGGLIFSFVFWGFGFLRMTTTGLVAQAHGAADGTGLRLVLARSLLLAGLLGSAVILLQAPLIHGALLLIGGSDAVRRNAFLYCDARIWSAPATLANYVVLGTLFGLQRARLALFVQIVINLANMAFALSFVYGFGWGVGGLGAATAAADWTGLALAAWLFRAPIARSLGAIDRRALFDRQARMALLLVNRDVFIRTLCLLGSFGWFSHEGAAEGDIVLAGNAILLNFQTFMAYGLDGFANAAEALVGAAVGARDRAALDGAIRASTLWALGTALAFALAYAGFGRGIVALLTSDPAVRASAGLYLPWAIVSPLISVWGFQLDGIFIGATRSGDLRRAMVASFVIFLAAALILKPVFGNHGLWAALMIFMAARGLTLGGLLPGLKRTVAQG
jgi:MATE family multidrug resistance protein